METGLSPADWYSGRKITGQGNKKSRVKRPFFEETQR
jgi:hypothetical protein